MASDLSHPANKEAMMKFSAVFREKEPRSFLTALFSSDHLAMRPVTERHLAFRSFEVTEDMIALMRKAIAAGPHAEHLTDADAPAKIVSLYLRDYGWVTPPGYELVRVITVPEPMPEEADTAELAPCDDPECRHCRPGNPALTNPWGRGY